MKDRGRQRSRERGANGPLLGGTVLSALLHALAIALVLLAPHRLSPAPPTAYTVEVIDPSALGGKLLAGPIGGDAAARQSAAARAKAADKPKEKPAEKPPPEPAKPELVAKAEPPKPEVRKPEPKPADDVAAVPIGKAKPTPQPTKRAAPAPKPTQTAALRARPKPTASPVAVAKRVAPSVAASPSRQAKGPSADSAERASPADIEKRLAAAIKDVETKVERGGARAVGAVGPAGGQGGTEQTLDGPPGVGGEGPGGGGTVRGLEFIIYYNQMLSRIKESWAWVGGRSDLRVTVRFSILDNGEISNLQLVVRSGDAGYDGSVIRAVKLASPLGPPPAEYRRDFADVELTFRPADLAGPPG